MNRAAWEVVVRRHLWVSAEEFSRGREEEAMLHGIVHVSSPLEEHSRLLRIVASLIASDVKARRTATLERLNLKAENRRLRSALEERFRPENIVGNSHAMQGVYQRIHQVAAGHTTVLIRGESGTGKELVASAIHYTSPRASKPFVKVNCAALDTESDKAGLVAI